MSEDTDKATSIIARLTASKELYQSYTNQFGENFMIDGKSMSEWSKYFKVHVPRDLNPGTAQHLSMTLMTLYQEASDYKTSAEARLMAMTSVTKALTRDKYTALLVEYKATDRKIPAASTLTTESESAYGKELDSLIHIEVELIFWKGIINSLQESRKHVETATWNLSVEAKAIGYEARMDGLNKKEY